MESCEGTLIVCINANRLDAASSPSFRDQLRAADAQSAAHLVLDVSKVDFIDSTGLGSVISVLKARPRGADFTLAGVTENVRRLLRLTRMDTIVTITPDVETALRRPLSSRQA